MFRPATSLRTPSKTFFAELFAAPGPLTIGQTGDNSYPVLFGRVWVLEVRADGALRLHQRQEDGTYQQVIDDLPPVFSEGAPAGSRRWSLAFDQAARVVVAYEDGEGVVRVTRWDPSANQYVQNVTFAGVDPVVVMDASWSYAIPGSDVLLFYLSPDRTRVLCRVQRDVYAIEHLIWDYGLPVILDRVIAAPIRYQLLVSDATGVPLPEALVSDPYPYPGTDKLRASLDLTGVGDYFSVVISKAGQDDLGAAFTLAPEGTYGPAVLTPEGTDALVGAFALTGTGEAIGVVLLHQQGEALEGAFALTSDGEYLLVVLSHGSMETLEATFALGPGGTYGPP